MEWSAFAASGDGHLCLHDAAAMQHDEFFARYRRVLV
jgi:hypothetical protein